MIKLTTKQVFGTGLDLGLIVSMWVPGPEIASYEIAVSGDWDALTLQDRVPDLRTVDDGSSQYAFSVGVVPLTPDGHAFVQLMEEERVRLQSTLHL